MRIFTTFALCVALLAVSVHSVCQIDKFTNCMDCTENGCTKCNADYSLNRTTCVECSKVPYCQTCDGTAGCAKCKGGYVADQAKSCLKCGVSYCNVCPLDGYQQACRECMTGYTLKEYKCEANPAGETGTNNTSNTTNTSNNTTNATANGTTANKTTSKTGTPVKKTEEDEKKSSNLTEIFFIGFLVAFNLLF